MLLSTHGLTPIVAWLLADDSPFLDVAAVDAFMVSVIFLLGVEADAESVKEVTWSGDSETCS